MATRIEQDGFRLDARPDRTDLRDRPYQPQLVSLPDRFPSRQFIEDHFGKYQKLVLDQGNEGACTGFGLAAVINYLFWKKAIDEKGKPDPSVSPHMLYQLARVYDEWPGEDYEGSSCRGAMKGWHKHGVCTSKEWPPGRLALGSKARTRGGTARARSFNAPRAGWSEAAAARPLGAYYRVDKSSIADMQSALFEVGALFCSADTHRGWNQPVRLREDDLLPVIALAHPNDGGHAFALVGYTDLGFIVQNSWGEDWGEHGFAILTYDDWEQNGMDAWVAVLGAPTRVAVRPRTRVTRSLADAGAEQAEIHAHAQRFRAANPGVGADAVLGTEPLTEAGAQLHSVFLGNDGRPLNYFVDLPTAADAVHEVVCTLPDAHFQRNQAEPRRIALYAHGGLNSEADGVERTRIMAPYFLGNGIYPVFVNWRTGFFESLRNIGADAFSGVFGEEPRAGAGLIDWLKEKAEAAAAALAEARDRALEVVFEKLLVKAVWTQMKQNAEAAADKGGGLGVLADALVALTKEQPGPVEIHLCGHSAGSILLGHLLPLLTARKLAAHTMQLYAPACTVGFALQKYGPALDKGTIAGNRFHVDLMSEERERADSVGPYGKSLLYLVSRALETVHKMPLLGMEAAWSKKAEPHDVWNEGRHVDVAEWRELMKPHAGVLQVHDKRRAQVSDGVQQIPLAHGSFDNDVQVVTRTLERMRSGGALPVPVRSLAGF